MTPEELTQSLKSEASRLGFGLVGVCPAVRPLRLSEFHAWLDRGYAGEMDYLEDRRAAYSTPASILDGARSIVMLGMSYLSREPVATRAGQGRVSRYAWNENDYHDLIHERLKELKKHFQSIVPWAAVRTVIDTAPLLEREFAALAGLGWQGKNTLLLNRSQGSWFFLAALLTDIELQFDQPFVEDHCGTCTACLDACPTSAFVAPRVLDANRCISYLTIEHRSPIDHSLREQLGDWVFGCDICQDVCPWNRKVTPTTIEEFQPSEATNPMDLPPLFELNEEEFRARFRLTALWRPRRRGILRNAAIVLGNQRVTSSVPALIRGLNDVDALIRGATAWALGRIGDSAALDALRTRQTLETDAYVRSEIESALHGN
jgi:epoxyqueuosine reductase